MKKQKLINDWFFLRINLKEKESILNNIKGINSISSLKMDLRPFDVPGTLQSNIRDLLNIDPYFEKNILEFSSYENDALLLVCEITFKGINKEFYLFFDHIDTISEIFLNGCLIGETKNGFIKHKISLPAPLIKQGNNLIAIILSPAMAFVDKKIDLPEIRDRAFVRRPAYNYGWDFAPRTILQGLGNVELFEKEDISLTDIYVFTKNCSEKKAEIGLEWTIESKYNAQNEFILEIKDLTTNKTIYSDNFLQNLRKGENFCKKDLTLNKPNLWWPNGHGNQPLYELELKERATGISIYTKFGVREISLLLENNNDHSFIFEINSLKIWAKGANWVPTDALTNYSEAKKYRELLSLAKDANFNMIRVWGGGVVEKDIFYDLCDELGIMIWHDFQFACSVYPETEEYLENVENEITHILKRLRNHPSIVLWCGNNENEWIDFQNYTEGYREEIKLGEKFHQLKERLCQQFDLTRPYWRSSPWSPSSQESYSSDPNSQEEGNCHDWFVWHGLGQPNLEPPEYKYYANNTAKFISEFGIQSLPSRETIDRIFSPTTQSAPNDVWEFHNCNLHKIKVNLDKFGHPKTINDWILYTQAAQAFGLKFAIEIWRSRKFMTAGSLIWQLNEPWPTICWSLIDYYNRPKMAYWFVKRAFEPLIVLQDHEGKIIIVNDYNKKIKGTLLLLEYTLEGKLITDERYALSIGANDTYEFVVKSDTLSKDNLRWIKFSNEHMFAENLILPCDPIEIDFPDPKINAILDRKNQFLTLQSEELAFIVELPSEYEPDDNYFHLIPQISKKIKINKLPKNSKMDISIWKYKKKYVELKTG